MKLNKMVAIGLGVVLTSSTVLSQVGAVDAASKLIGSTKAKEIMLKKVPGAKIVKFRLDNDRTPEYEGELTKGSYKYEISVNAITGKITDFEKVLWLGGFVLYMMFPLKYILYYIEIVGIIYVLLRAKWEKGGILFK